MKTKALALILLTSVLAFCGADRIHAQQLSAAFADCGLVGSITIYDYQKQQWIASDIEDSHVRTLPASTFKIVNTLIALETGVIASEEEIIPWPDTYDTTRYGHRPEIYHSMSMHEAFIKSAGWAYVELAKKVGKARYAQYLGQLDYGNGNLNSAGTDFWNFGGFGVSPVEQIKTLVGIYEERYPFASRSYATLKELMLAEQTAAYTIRAKTGWTRDGGIDTGWWVGYVEQQGNVLFFATRLIKPRTESNTRFGPCRKEITKKVLRQLRYL